MKKILSTRVLVKICVLTTILLVLIIYTIWGNSALMVSMVNISSDRIASAFSNFRIAQVSDLHNAEFGESNTELIEYCYHIGQSYLKPMYAVVLIWFYVVMHTEGSFDYLLLGGSLPPIKGCFLNMIPAFIQTERQIWLLAAALEIVLFHSDLIIVQRLY